VVAVVFGVLYLGRFAIPGDFFLFSRLRKEHVPSLVIMLICILALSGGGFYLLWQAFFVYLDPQSGIVFVMLPLYQLGGAVIGILAALVIGAIFDKKSNTSS
jgi:hypothetical protein